MHLSLRGAFALVLLTLAAPAQTDRPLPSWNDGAARTAVLEFVERVTKPGSPDFVAVPERIATFDNDGTLWLEHPMYTQGVFAFDRVHTLAPQHPDWKTSEPFKSVLAGDLKTALAGGDRALLEIVAATHAGMSTQDFEGIVLDWIAKARDKRFKRPYTELVYQPMLELLAYLRQHDFETWIVSGGGIEFMRPWTQRVYGIPPQQVVGSSIQVEYQMKDGVPVLMRLPKLNFVDDKSGKPIGINLHIGKRPIAAFGNSDGDIEMLTWATSGPGATLGLLVHHTDAEREYAYDRDTHVGRLDKGLEVAKQLGWTVVSMKTDWAQIFPPEKR